jgi:alpha 1,2-mannosyltransferase
MFFRPKTLLLATCVAGLLFLLSTHWSERKEWGQSLSNSVDNVIGSQKEVKVDHDEQIAFWASLATLYNQSQPGVAGIKKDKSTKVISFDSLDFEDTDRQPIQHLLMSDKEVGKMQKAHAQFKKAIEEDPPSLVYSPGTRGIVVTAGGKYLPLVVISLRVMKRIGNTMPMEVFLETAAEYESHICEQVLPSLNARCVILSEIMDPVPHPVQLKAYQLKIFALIFSSFEEVMFLDADSWPTQNPAPLFDCEPFLSTGLVTWPDFWAISPSEHWYTISNSPVPPMTKRASSETGEILISKSRHEMTLLLASYYNYFGPGQYYRLFSQGAAGEGDKETFLAAADVLNAPYYAVSEPIIAIGHLTGTKLAGSAMVQFDPREDYALTSAGKWRVKNKNVAPRPKPMFIHANFPKLNPGVIYDNAKITKMANGTMRRAWDIPPALQDDLGVDVERRFWEEAEWVACNLETKFRNWYSLTGTCDKARSYYKNVFGDIKMPDYHDD